MADFVERRLSAEEFSIADWLLRNSAKASAQDYLPQLADVRVTGICSCGCPTVNLQVADGVAAASDAENPVADAFGTVDGKEVGVMLLQKDGKLTCLEVYDLSDIQRPYGLPELKTLKVAQWSEPASPKLVRNERGFLVVAKTGRVITTEMVKELSEDDFV